MALAARLPKDWTVASIPKAEPRKSLGGLADRVDDRGGGQQARDDGKADDARRAMAMLLIACRRVTAVVFDKTVTLTFGRPLVASVVSLSAGYTADEVLSLAASGELHARHPLAQAIAGLRPAG
ncbi:hypothetical protein [Streptomyces inhibens]|uniref:hypothetical protein n=1 Tax=Streptomyces inhibens TaxID=2293571 RepID=UPI001EE75DE4|nr:hypothetical protein [Streptomyces inhibens]UKY47533.1 hypothetical protein KI385_00810 [Streptomyces inhibens]